MNRKRIVLHSGAIVLIAQVITSGISFVMRNAFIYGVGIDYLGLNGVIADILAMLSLTELGFQFAIIYRLYKPIAEKNHQIINEILCLLKKIYQVIGAIIIVFGFSIVPFLKYIIHDVSVSKSTILISYFIYVMATASTYFMAYKRTLLYADQKQHIISIMDMLSSIFFGCLKILSLLIMKQYLLFVLFYLLEKLASNIIIIIYTKQKYPWINIKNHISDLELRKDVIQDTKNIFSGKIAGYIYSSTDNLIISTFISTRIIGYVGNYKTVFSTIHTLLTASLTPFRPMIGNYLVNHSRENAYKLFKNYGFLRYIIALIILEPTLVLIDIFISLWIGEEYCLNGKITYLLFLDIYISIIHGPPAEYIEVLGFFKQAKITYIIGATANVVLSLIGARIIGVEGVFLATVVSQLIMWIGRSWIIFSEYFKDMYHYIKYWGIQILYGINFLVVYKISLKVIKSIRIQNYFVHFIIGGFICMIIALVDIIVIFRKTGEFHYLKNSAVEILREKFDK